MITNTSGSKSIWPNSQLRRVEDYRSELERQRLLQLFGVESPVVMVTGSSAARVGNTIARHFAARGYRVVFHANSSVERGRHMVSLCEQASIDAMLVTGDIALESDVKRWLQEIDARFGRLDAVIHCAATWDHLSLESTTQEQLEKNLREHAVGSFLVAQHAGLFMAQQTHGGSIVMTGDWAYERPYPGFAAYFAGKGAIPAITRTFAVELADRNTKIRVNSILPGTVLLGNDMPNRVEEELAHAALVKRIGTPEEMAMAAIFLTENPFVTGVCLHVDGGRHCFAGPGVDGIAHPQIAGKMS